MSKFYKNKVWLYQRYVVEHKSPAEMAKEAGCSMQTIYNELWKLGYAKKK